MEAAPAAGLPQVEVPVPVPGGAGCEDGHEDDGPPAAIWVSMPGMTGMTGIEPGLQLPHAFIEGVGYYLLLSMPEIFKISRFMHLSPTACDMVALKPLCVQYGHFITIAHLSPRVGSMVSFEPLCTQALRWVWSL